MLNNKQHKKQLVPGMLFLLTNFYCLVFEVKKITASNQKIINYQIVTSGRTIINLSARANNKQGISWEQILLLDPINIVVDDVDVRLINQNE